MADQIQPVKRRGGRPKQSPLLKLNIETPKDVEVIWDRSTDIVSVDTTARDVNAAMKGLDIFKTILLANIEGNETTKAQLTGWIEELSGRTKLGILRNRDTFMDEED